MSREKIITAIDLGTEKCITLVASHSDEDRQLKVLGISVVASRGVKKSMIIDLEEALSSISESLDAVERMAGFDINSAYVAISGSHIQSRNSKGVVAVANPHQEIIPEDVERVIEAARAISLPSGRQVLHVIPRYFKVDSQEGIKDPVGMTGVRLESEAHIITGMTTSLKNVEKCLNDLGLTVDGFVFSSIASSEVVLSETEKELGVVLIEIGAGSSNFCVFVEGSMEFSGSLPIGARHITQDIALGCRISIQAAEKIKLALSSEKFATIKARPGESKDDLNKRRKKADKIDLEALGIYETDDKLSKKVLLEGIMVPRMKEILQMIAQELNKKNLLTQIPAGVVLTGGGAETVGIVDVAKKVFRLPARVGQPKQLAGLTTDILSPAYTTAVGLLVYGLAHGGGAQAKRGINFNLDFLKSLPLKSAAKGIGDLIKKLLP